MNRFFRHIWSKALGRVIVVPECIRGEGKRSGRRRRAPRLVAPVLLLTWMPGLAIAADTTIDGGAAITYTAPVDVSGYLEVGDAGTGELTVGAGGDVTNVTDLFVGSGDNGTLNIENGGNVSSNNGYLGNGAGATGEVTVTGSDSTWSTDGIQYIGRLGDGTLTISDGGVVANTNAGTSAEVGFGYDGVDWDTEYNTEGTIIVTDPGSRWDNAGAIYIGARDTGNLTISHGGVVTSALGVLGGNDTDAAGTVLVTGGGSQWNDSVRIDVGNGDTGILTIADGGAVNIDSGSGTVRIGILGTGDGTLNIGAASGGMAVEAGTLNAANVQFGSGVGQIVFNHTEGAYNFAASISGGGSVLVENGTTRLAGANTYSGGTTISDGTLIGGTDNLQGDIINNGALVFEQGVDGTYAGILSGAGALTKQGAGNVTLSSNLAGFTGTTTVSSGTLTVTGTLGDQNGGDNGSSLTVETGGTLSIGTSRHVSAAAIVNNSGGVIDLGLEASLHGTGNTLNNGGVINVGDLGLVEDAGAINNLAGGVINFSGEGQMEADSDNDALGSEFIINDGEINLHGGNTATVEFSSAVNQGSGQINVNDGHLRVLHLTNVSAGGAAGGAGGVDISASGILEVSWPLSNNAGGEITNAGMLGSSEIWNAAGAVLTSTGTLTTSHGTGLRNRGIVNAAGSINGAVHNQDTGVFNVTGALTANNGFDLEDSSALNVTGGDLSVTGTLKNQSTAAGINVAAGRMLSADDVDNGDAHTDAAILNDGTLSAASGVRNYGTILNNGTIEGRVWNYGTLTNHGNLDGYFSNYGTAANSGTIQSVNVDAGTFTNTGMIADPGAIDIRGGTFITHAEGQAGDIVNDGALVFDQSVDGSYSGVISGTGSLSKQGVGALTLSNDSSAFAGITTVSGGTLVINGTLGGALNMDGGRLGGSGSLGDVVLESGAILTPGNSIGTMNVVNYTFNPGSAYEVEIRNGGFVAGTHNDWLNAANTVTINGGTVHVTPENGTDDGSAYTPGTYTIVTAGTVTGTFDNVTDDYVFLDFTESYDASNVYLTSTQAVLFSGIAETSNQQAVAGPLEVLGGGNAVHDALIGLGGTQDEARAAFDALTGEVHASMQIALIDDSRFARGAAQARLGSKLGGVASGGGGISEKTLTDGLTDGLSLWGQGFGAWGTWDDDGNAAELGRSIHGLFMGADLPVAQQARLGVFGGYSRTDADVDARASSVEAHTWHAGVYGGTQAGPFILQAGGAYAWHDLTSTREAAFTGFSETLSASYNGTSGQLFAEAGYGIATGHGALEPYAGLAHLLLETDGFSETGGEAALSAAGTSGSTTFATLGLRGETALALGGAAKITLTGDIGWRHAFGDTAPDTHMTFAGGNVFTVAGMPVDEDVLIVETGITMALENGATLGFSYSGQIGADSRDHGLMARIGITF